MCNIVIGRMCSTLLAMLTIIRVVWFSVAMHGCGCVSI